MIDISYDKNSKEFYLYFQGKRYNITNTEIHKLKDRLNSLENQSLSTQKNGNQNLL